MCTRRIKLVVVSDVILSVPTLLDWKLGDVGRKFAPSLTVGRDVEKEKRRTYIKVNIVYQRDKQVGNKLTRSNGVPQGLKAPFQNVAMVIFYHRMCDIHGSK